MSTVIGSVTISRNPSASSDWGTVRLNQSTVRTADGGTCTYDNGPEEIRGVLFIRNVPKAEKDSLMSYLRNTAIYGLNSFTITPPSGTDIGAGNGVALSNCYFDGDPTLEGVFTWNPPGVFDVKLPYRKLV